MTQPDSSVAEQIFFEYKPRIYGYMQAKNVPLSDRDDLLGEIMLRATRYGGSYDPAKASLSTWVYTLCRSVVASYYRKLRPEMPILETVPSDFSVEHQAELMDELRQLAQALERLPERERLIIILHYYKEMPHARIAQVMQLSEVNVRVICSRSIKKLKGLLAISQDE